MKKIMRALFAHHALLPAGWASDVLLQWDEGGDLVRVAAGELAPAELANIEIVQYALPGMINLHSHSFQRGYAGLAERAGGTGNNTDDSADSFWSWRELLYRYAQRITPQQIEAIAAQLFCDCLRHGYTAVCEFHYLQRGPGGAPYARAAETAERVIAAARQSGIGITLLPALYSHANFGGAALTPQQRRFDTGVDHVLAIIDALESQRDGQTEIGFAPHSLRAATTAQIREVLLSLPAQRPVHIHIAEQQQEVAQCLAWNGRRPLQHLFDEIDVDRRWCLVHATHADVDEIARMAASGAVAGLCTSTEANLGDGLFAFDAWNAAGGAFGIGSDSQVSHSPVEELRWLEYGQRLRLQRRNIAASKEQSSVGDFLWQGALRGGAQASGRRVGALAAGMRADLIVLDDRHLCGLAPQEILGSVIFCGSDNPVKHVLAGGQWLVRDGRHVAQQAIAERYKRALQQLRQG